MAHDPTQVGTLTKLLRASREGDDVARDALFRRVNAELRRTGQTLLRKKGIARSTLSGTELVSKACVRLLGREQLDADDRKHFFFLLGRAMRDELVESIRFDLAEVRGGTADIQTGMDLDLEDPEGDPESIAASRHDLADACRILSEIDESAARLIQLRFTRNLSLRDLAGEAGLPLHRVRADVDYGMAWLRAYFDHAEKD